MPRYALDHAGGWVRADGTSVRYCGRQCAFLLEHDDARRQMHKSVTAESKGELELDEDNEFRFDAGVCSHCGARVV